MADNTATDNEGLWFPDEVWITITSLLDNSDLARFRQLCSATQFFGSEAFILQPHYNRLYAIDNTLPALLPQKGALAAFKQAFEKIQARQQSEITYLKKHHPEKMAESEQVFQENTTVSLKSLEAKSTALDKINSDIIREKINLNSTILNLDNAGITRLPVTLFLEINYAHFWQNLIHLNCNYNQITVLNLQGLTALEKLFCYHNKVHVLNLQGLATLRLIFCGKNLLTSLNVQGLTLLENLNCHNNPLKTLILTGVPASIKNQYAELERKLLFDELSQTKSSEAKQAIIHRLGTDYTPENCRKYCPIYAEKFFPSDPVNSALRFASNALAQASAFLPSFATTNTGLKRKRDEEIDTEELSEEPDNQPTLKKRKKK